MIKVDFKKMGGLVPAILQDFDSGQVLMLGYMNEDALKKTLDDGKVTFWSRSKERLWQKGETSGNYLSVVDIKPDCDNDALLVKARPVGPICHEGTKSCFGKEEFGLKSLFALIAERKLEMPEGSYTTSLFKAGKESMYAKIDEECEEVIRASKAEGKQRVKEEACDVLYHLFVLLAEENISIEEIEAELKKRNLK